jgi:hypothetical protein
MTVTFLINSRQPGPCKTFHEYANEIISPYIEHCGQRHGRIEVVFDVYYENSLKGETRRKRGIGGRRKLTANSRPPKAWNTFLRCDKNKTELFGFLADKIAGMICETAIFVTKDEHVLINNEGDVSHISPCNHEEADSRIFLHAKDAAINGSNSIMIVSSDTDVVIGISLFAQLEVEQLWIAFGKGKDFRWVPIHDIAKALGPRARALPFFHAFSGCDTVSAFTGKGKIMLASMECLP